MTANVNVNVAPAPTRPYVNADGLAVKYGPLEAEIGNGGEFATMVGNQHCTEWLIDWEVMALGTDATHNVIFDYDTVLPAGAVPERAEFNVTEAWAGSSMTLSLGLVQRDDFTTIIDADGLLAQAAVAVVDAAGNRVASEQAGGYPDVTTHSGALMGDALTENGILSGYWVTAVPTAGQALFRVFWRSNVATFVQ